LTPNTTAWCEALDDFLDGQGYKLQGNVCSMYTKAIFLLLTLFREICSINSVMPSRAYSRPTPHFHLYAILLIYNTSDSVPCSSSFILLSCPLESSFDT
ncbi:hypothetical protein PAXRUDRAFT_170655, partial [Paxillus rubicundulus Ve08.2h10]